jgi:hypothetical protein
MQDATGIACQQFLLDKSRILDFTAIYYKIYPVQANELCSGEDLCQIRPVKNGKKITMLQAYVECDNLHLLGGDLRNQPCNQS